MPTALKMVLFAAMTVIGATWLLMNVVPLDVMKAFLLGERPPPHVRLTESDRQAMKIHMESVLVDTLGNVSGAKPLSDKIRALPDLLVPLNADPCSTEHRQQLSTLIGEIFHLEMELGGFERFRTLNITVDALYLHQFLKWGTLDPASVPAAVYTSTYSSPEQYRPYHEQLRKACE